MVYKFSSFCLNVNYIDLTIPLLTLSSAGYTSRRTIQFCGIFYTAPRTLLNGRWKADPDPGGPAGADSSGSPKFFP